jgi:hypothetical protein
VASHFQYTERQPDTLSLQVFHWSYRVFDELIRRSDPTGITRKRLDQLYGTTPWLRSTPAGDVGDGTWTIHNLDVPLLDQFVSIYADHDNSEVRHLSIVSPYFDHKLRALSELLNRFHPKEVRIYSKDPQGLDPEVLLRIESEHRVAFRFGELDCENRPLHAKAVVLRTDKGAWSIAGSANLSAPAWLKPAGSGNMEIVIIRYEPDPDYFDKWLDEITKTGRSIGINSIEFTPASEWSKGNGPDRSLQIEAASVNGKELIITLGSEDAAGRAATLILDVPGEPRAVQLQLGELKQEFKVSLDNRTLQLLESPSSCWLQFQSTDGGTLRSNAVIITNLNALSRFTRPLTRKDRPQIPQGLRPESYEQCLELLGMLEDLFAKNAKELDRHRSRIGKRQRDVEKQMVIEEEGEYIPSEHIVDEPVRTPYLTAGEQLYADYYDRLTYEELLSIVLRAVYRPLSKARSELPPTNLDEIDESDRELAKLREDVGDEARRTMSARIESRFGTLVHNFTLGTRDEVYLEEVPPIYLLEIFIVIVSYLRIVWLDEFLSTERFLDLSYDLLVAMWGWPGEEGAWHQIRPRMNDAELRDAEERLGLTATIWILAYLMSELLAQRDMKGYYNLAAWIRHAMDELKPPEILQNLGESEFSRLRNSTFPERLREESPPEIVSALSSLAERYDDFTLIAEIISEPASRATIDLKTVAGKKNVPALLVKTALTEEGFDRCFELFKIFLANPAPKVYTWAQFTNINPPTSEDDINKVIMFYRADRKSFDLVAEREAQADYRPNISVKDLDRQRLLECQSIAEVLELARSS